MATERWHRNEQTDNREASGSALSQQWEWVCSRLRAEYGEEVFVSWLGRLEFEECREGRVTLRAPSAFVRQYIATHFLDRLFDIWQRRDPSIRRVDVEVARAAAQQHAEGEAAAEDGMSALSSRPANDERSMSSHLAARNTMAGVSAAVPQIAIGDAANGARSLVAPFSTPLNPNFTFDKFVVGKPNEMAYAASQRVSELVNCPYNPLFLYSEPGLGKTHLMHAIAWEIQRRHSDRRVIYISAETFLIQFVNALRHKTTMAFKEAFRNVDVLMIDDVQFISGKETTQEEFFHTFNALIDHKRQIVLSADRAPVRLEGIEERIRSRMGCGLSVHVMPTDYELRLGILQVKADELRAQPGWSHIELHQDVMEYLASHLSGNVRDLAGALNSLFAHSDQLGRPLSVDQAAHIVRDFVESARRPVTVEEIQLAVAEFYNIRQSDILSSRRARTVAAPRHVAMYLAKVLTTNSYPDIGRRFGGRDHTTVMHAVRKMERMLEQDSALRGEVEQLRRHLGV